ncbi:MAG TPA: hypothetical protein ENI81_08385, partial [Phycisphaerales bacterium]|nr:hypothetical protein [Phycisphaerales bacterium]
MKSDESCRLAARYGACREKNANLSIAKRTIALVLILGSAAVSHAQQPVYLDSSRSIRQRVDDLLRRMTLEEKIGQMNMPCAYLGAFGRTREENLEFTRKFTQGALSDYLGPGGGFFTFANHHLTEG